MVIEQFEYITDVVDKIDALIEQAEHTKSRIEKRKLLKEAQELADAYEKHCGVTKLFNKIYEP